MRIPDNYTSDTAPAQARKAETLDRTGPHAGSLTPGAGAADELRMSRLTDTLRATASADTPGRAERLAQLASAYAAGKYSADAASLSRSIVEGALAGD